MFGQYLRVCYHTNWSQYRHGHGKFLPENIPIHLCSHVVYAFASMEGNRLKPFEWNDDKGGYQTESMYDIILYILGS